MKFNTINISTGLLVLAGVISISWWLGYDPVNELVTTEPGLDNRGAKAVIPDIEIGAFYEALPAAGEPGSAAALNETWPRFRGAYFDNISRSPVKLIDRFPEQGPEQLWKVDLGEGYAAAAIYKGLVYVLDHDEEMRADLLRCFRLESGEELWRRGYQINLKRNHGMSRTVPAVTEDYILTIGPKAHVMCVRRADGELLWGLNVALDYEAEIPLWNTGQCPLIDGDRAIIATGGSSLMVAADLETGEILWEAPNPNNWLMSHSSIMPYEFNGVKMYVYSAFGGVCGIGAEGEMAGKVLWESQAWNHQTVAPSPVCLPDGKIFLTAGYGAGGMVIQLSGTGSQFQVEVISEYLPKEGLASEQQTPVVFDGHLLGILPKDAGPLRNQLVCVHPDNFNEVVWSSGPEKRFGLGPFMIADGKLFLLNDDGTLVIARPSTSTYQELDRYQVIDGHDAWGPLAVADGYMVLRDAKTMICIDLAVDRN